uniref:Peroxisomal membrane protein PEX14 n=1 Tax=Nicotiana tabacum TaxID=4097 RepID=A0A1S3Y233_TOBAC|nr:PREDICTED: peroxisomal membrane protein PEX14-like [Nicotiana tabacum]
MALEKESEILQREVQDPHQMRNALCQTQVIIPRLKSWIRKVVMDEEDEKDIVKEKPSLAEEAVVAAKAADVARASQEMLASKSEEKRYFEELTSLLNYQVREMKSMTSPIEKLEGQSNTSGRIPITELDDRRTSVTQSRVRLYSNTEIWIL